MKLRSIVENILNEKRRSKRLSLEETSKRFLKNARSYNPEASQIFRGVSGFDANYGVVDPKAGKENRKSKHTHNFYTLVIDNSEEWEEWPKRSQSIVCSTSATYAASYGQNYLVIPFDGAEIGVAPAKDIWYSFRDFNARRFNEALNSIYEDFFNKRLSGLEFQKFKDSVNKLGEKLSENAEYSPLDGTAKRIVEKWKDPKYETLFELIKDIFSPFKNNFQLHTYDPSFRVSEGVEVWTSSKSILIRDDKIKVFFEYVNQVSQGLHYNYEKVIEKYSLEQT